MSHTYHDTDFIDATISALETRGYRVLRPALTTPDALNQWLRNEDIYTAPIARGIVLDCEATSADASTAEPMQIGCVAFQYHQTTGQILAVSQSLVMHHEPTHPPLPEAFAVHGLTMDDVRGCDARGALDALVRATQLHNKNTPPLIIAHNAAYDRPVVERAIPLPPCPWGCSVRDIPWKAHGYSSSALRVLLSEHANHYLPVGQKHDALLDVFATVMMLAVPFADGTYPLRALLNTVEHEHMHISARNTAFHTKDTLRARGYRWEPEHKAWARVVPATDLAAERDWLGTHVYGYNLDRTPSALVVTTIAPVDRYRAGMPT